MFLHIIYSFHPLVFGYSSMGICLRALLPVKKTGPSGLDWGLARGLRFLCSMFVSLTIVRWRDVVAFGDALSLLWVERRSLLLSFFSSQQFISKVEFDIHYQSHP